MNAELHLLTGARAGLTIELLRGAVTLGRDPGCDVQLHPEEDLEVSARHAVLLQQGAHWLIRDLGSRNGTYLNGHRIAADTVLRNGDQLTLGPNGPQLELRTASIDPGEPTLPAGLNARLESTQAAALMRGNRASPGDRAGAARSPRLRVTVLLLITMLAIVTALAYAGMRERAAWYRERVAMQQRIDSVLVASDRSVQMLEGELAGLSDALRQSQEEVRQARGQLRQAETVGETSELPQLRRQVQAATAALERQQLAAALDFRGIEQRNRSAIAMLHVESESGEVFTATAFAVRPNATLLTSRHVVTGERGLGRPRRMAIQFADSEQAWPARLLLVSGDVDLAVVKVDNILGAVPVVRGFNTRADTIRAGVPVALIGFPLGGNTTASGSRGVGRVTPLITAGVVSARRAGRLEVQGYGAAGGSGSPIFDGNGEVIGVLFGGRRGATGQTLFGVPSAAALQLLERLP